MLQLVALRAFATVAILFCLAVVVLIEVIQAYFVELGLYQQIGLILTAATVLNIVLVAVFNYVWRFIWRCIPALNNHLFPDWNGTWDVKIHWQRVGRNGTVEAEGTVQAEAEIKQNLLKVSITLQSEKSRSETLSVVPKKHPESSRPELHYLYRAEPTAGYQHDNPAHDGAAILKPDLDSNDFLKGNYFTSRATLGHYEMTRPRATD